MRVQFAAFLAGLAVCGALACVVPVASPPPIPTGAEQALYDRPFVEESVLTSFLDEQVWDAGFYVKQLSTGAVLARYAERPVCLASITKVFCLTELYRQKHETGLDLALGINVLNHGVMSLKEAAALMIAQSDNDATHALAEFLGRDRVNRVPALLGIPSMSPQILPEEHVLREVLDARIREDRQARALLPQHGSARGIAHYFELLLRGGVFSPAISSDLVDFFSEHPKPFSLHYAERYRFAGKGGNILWTRPPKHYAMMGWGLFVTSPTGEHLVLCVWGEWFPETMPPERQAECLKFVTDCLMAIMERTTLSETDNADGARPEPH